MELRIRSATKSGDALISVQHPWHGAFVREGPSTGSAAEAQGQKTPMKSGTIIKISTAARTRFILKLYPCRERVSRKVFGSRGEKA